MPRRLVAILALDAAGYSRLMGEDEAGTLADLKRHRGELIDPCIAAHGGRLVKATGDGLLVEFPSSVAAVACAVEIQRGMDRRSADQPAARRMLFRAGVQVGDVIDDDGDLFGDVVNVAARLQALADPGGIVVSDDVWRQVDGRIAADFTDRGRVELKNIARPVHVHAMAGSAPSDTGRPAPPPTIAVLPFLNLGGDPAQAYLSDGITEDIITELSRFRPLAVIARTSSFQYRDRAMPVQEIGKALKAAFIVEGSVRRGGSRMRITGQLIEAATGRHLWAERYDRDASDLFEVQDEVVRNVAFAVAARLSDELVETARRKRPEDLVAYDCFLRGNRLMDGPPADREAARVLFEQARAIDPAFARAYTGLAWLKVIDSFTPMPLPAMRQLLDQAGALAATALASDPNDARVQYTFGWIRCQLGDFVQGRVHLERAAALNPNDSVVLLITATARALAGDLAGAHLLLADAERLNPILPSWHSWYVARILFLERRHAEALARLDTGGISGTRQSAWRAAALAHLGRSDEAREEGRRFLALVEREWSGERPGGPEGYGEWLLHSTPLPDPRDLEHLRLGLRGAGLPV
ncbi:MAG: adenylate/guanylate cyclase domain-containing protein [Geminicoccaceae bacterium]